MLLLCWIEETVLSPLFENGGKAIGSSGSLFHVQDDENCILGNKVLLTARDEQI